MADPTAIDPDCLMTADAVGDRLVWEVITPKYSEKVRFYYLSRMTKHEVRIFKRWDSVNVRARSMSPTHSHVSDIDQYYHKLLRLTPWNTFRTVASIITLTGSRRRNPGN